MTLRDFLLAWHLATHQSALGGQFAASYFGKS